MALEIAVSIADQHDAGFASLGIDLPSAYIKVVAIIWHYQPEKDANGNTTKGEITFTTGIWASKAARDMSASPLGTKPYVLRNPNFSSDLLAQCYEAMKNEGNFFMLDLSKATNV